MRLNPFVDYKFSEINLFGSFRNNLDNYEKIMAALAETNLKDSDLEIHVDQENFSLKFHNRLAIKRYLMTVKDDLKTLKK